MLQRAGLFVSGAIFALASMPSAAQSNEWKFEGNFYLFTAETKTGVGGNEGTLSFSDALENLDMAFMAAFSATKGRLSFIADYMLTDLSFSSSVPGPSFSGARLSAKTQILTGVGLYNVYEENGTAIDLGGGFRWFDTDTTLNLRAGDLPAASRTENDSWVDPIVAARLRKQFNEQWSGTAVVDYGGVNDRETWQVLLTANYEFRENWVARFGYRYINVDNDEDGQDYTFEQSGPVIGIAYKF